MNSRMSLLLTGIILATALSCQKKNDDPAPAQTVIRDTTIKVITDTVKVDSSKIMWKTLTGERPLVIGHRGYAGLRPDHTLEGYQLAIDNGADYVEPDLVMTKDSQLVCRHEPFIGKTTNVSSLPEFLSRKTTKNVDGEMVNDWFVSDFTLAELKTLKARQPQDNRSKAYDDKFNIPTFQEVINLVKAQSAAKGRVIGVYPETKHPTFHDELGLKLTDKVLEVLEANGWNNAQAPVFLQSFEVSNLQYANSKSSVRLVQLIDAYDVTEDGKIYLQAPYEKPYDFVKAGRPETFEFLTTNAGLDFVKTYADGIGPWKPYIIPYKNSTMEKLPATDLVQRAHAKNLLVHVYTFRDEETTLLKEYYGDPHKEYKAFFDLGVDGVFTDFTATAVASRK